MTNKPEEKKADLLTVVEVAKRLRVNPSTVKRWIHQGSLEAVLLPTTGQRRMYRVKKAVVDAILNPKAGSEEAS